MTHPILYKKSSTGATQTWVIGVDGDTIVTTWGQSGGAMQTTRDVVTKGKNIGRSNETTPAQQALAEAAAQWEKKLKKGYVQSVEAAQAGEVDAVITGGISPMLAHRFDEQGHKLKYPCSVQPKLDGHRCIAIVGEDGEVTLWSRTRKPITSMVHIQNAINGLCLDPGTILDGELYNHAYKDRFEELTSFIRDTKFKPGAEVVQYHIYDLPSCSDHFNGRNTKLHGMLVSGSWGSACLKQPQLVYVPTRQVADEDEMMLAFDRFLAAGYEGAMARNSAGLYVNKRSYDLLKIKEFSDSEFLVTGVEEGRGKLAGHAIFVCKTAEGTEFRTKMKGETAALKQYWDDPSLAIGRSLTIKYQGITTKNGVPRFPVALRFKEDV